MGLMEKKQDRVGPVDNRPSTNLLHHFAIFYLYFVFKKKKNYYEIKKITNIKKLDGVGPVNNRPSTN